MDDLKGIDIATLFKMVKITPKTTEGFIAAAIVKYGNKFDYSMAVYDKNTKNTDMISIICPDHGKFEISKNRFLDNKDFKYGCKRCSPFYRRTQEEFIEDATKKHNGKYDYSKVEFKQMGMKITIICPIHGEFKCTGSHHLNDGVGCKDCQYDAKRHNNEIFIAKANEIHGEGTYCYSLVDYEGNNIKVKIICPKHGKFEQTPNGHLSQGQNCPKCANEALRMTQEEFIAKAKSIHGDVYDYSEAKYKTTQTKVRIKCIKHGITFDMTPNMHISLRCSGCPRCAPIGYSMKQLKWLSFMESYYKINIIHKGSVGYEYAIPSTKYHADGYHEATNTIYEFHGDYWHGNPKLYAADFMNVKKATPMGKLYQKTKQKEKCIKDLGYTLVVMWESNWNLIIKTIIHCQRRFRATRSE